MVKYNQQLIDSIYNKRLETHYNAWYIGPTNSPLRSKIELQGKIKCPVLNSNISSMACSKLMDKPSWPRGIDPEVCKKCNCFIYLSIVRYQNNKIKGPADEQKT